MNRVSFVAGLLGLSFVALAASPAQANVPSLTGGLGRGRAAIAGAVRGLGRGRLGASRGRPVVARSALGARPAAGSSRRAILRDAEVSLGEAVHTWSIANAQPGAPAYSEGKAEAGPLYVRAAEGFAAAGSFEQAANAYHEGIYQLDRHAQLPHAQLGVLRLQAARVNMSLARSALRTGNPRGAMYALGEAGDAFAQASTAVSTGHAPNGPRGRMLQAGHAYMQAARLATTQRAAGEISPATVSGWYGAAANAFENAGEHGQWAQAEERSANASVAEGQPRPAFIGLRRVGAYYRSIGNHPAAARVERLADAIERTAPPPR